MSVETERSRAQREILAELQHLTLTDDVDAVLFRAFVHELVDRIRGPYLAQHPPKQVVRHLREVFRFAEVRHPGEILADVRTGASDRSVRVFAVLDDQPFIVDTVRLFLRRSGSTPLGGFHAIVPVTRDEDGKLVGVGEGDGMESISLVEADAGDLAAHDPEDDAALLVRLEHAQATVRDFRPMVRAVERFVERASSMEDRYPDRADVFAETAAFLKWLLRDNFVFIGLEGPGGPLGVQALDAGFDGRRDGVWGDAHPPGTIQVRKGQRESPIHREGRVDELLVSLSDEPDDQLFIRGLFTYRAVTQPSRNVPVLRGVLRDVLAQIRAERGSYRYKGVANVFDSLPTEYLFTTPTADVLSMVELVLDSETQQEVGVVVQRRGDGSAFVLVSMPKTFYADDLRREVEGAIRSALRPTYLDHGLFVGRYDTLLLHYYLTGAAELVTTARDALEDRVRALATPWATRVWERIAKRDGDERADALVGTYGRAFPESWTRQVPVDRAVRDLENLEKLSPKRPVSADLFADADGDVTLRVYQTRNVYLTDLLPLLDHFGLVVKSSDAVEVNSRDGRLHIDTFVIEADGPVRQDLLRHRHQLLDAIPAVYEGKCDADDLNALVVQSGMTWSEVDVVRAYSRYMRQLQVRVSLPRVQTLLLGRPDMCRLLVDLFVARFDPDLDERTAAVAAAEDACQTALRKLETHDDDVVFGGIHNLIHATERTNAFRDDRVHHYLSFKIAAARVREMPGQRPLYEIYVHSRDVEGVHLRFGKVARGGLRWSDRADYRTEILGLVTTQQVKNVVIVPAGSKGGFYVRQPDPQAGRRRGQADALYEVFIRGLLDLTDNRVGESVQPPPRVVRHDDDDPYLVVAADKGTAHLSDTANRISAAYGFWLDDAFASGGSQGYDHKGVGITARGAWVLVKRHFAERGVDPYAEPFTVVGIGDMGGDVFGNGLLECKPTRLLAAFNHRHVFLDPDPDVEAAYAERKRLFEVAGREAGWDHYDTDLISEGGGVYDRSARSVELSPQSAAMLGLEGDAASPEEVIRAILTMEVDLLWSGGIGTYVKSPDESHADADDRANDRFRVDATALRARAVGEGANLSLTQQARIEAAALGVRLNTDFIDNSGGVDMSDHEVNLKILLAGPVQDGRLSMEERNRLLASLTDEVTALVLRNNDTHGRQLSRDELRSQRDVFAFGRAIAFVERVHEVSRETLVLPDESELRQRASDGTGLTRPELAVLSAWVKRWLREQLLSSGRLRRLEGFRDQLFGYFPERIQQEYADDVAGHPLADEIVATMVTTSVVADSGAAFVPVMVETTGRDAIEVVDAYLKSQRLARAGEVRTTLEELRASVQLTVLNSAWVQVDAGCRDVTGYWLGAGQRVPTESELVEMEAAVDQVYDLQAADVADANADTIARFLADDVPESVANVVVKSSYLNTALMVWAQAKHLDASFRDVGVCQLAIGRAARIQEVIDDLAVRRSEGTWEPIAVEILSNRFVRLLREAVRAVGPVDGDLTVEETEVRLLEGPVGVLREQVDRMLPEDEPADLATLIVLEERLAGAIARLRGGGDPGLMTPVAAR